jgi:LysM repeat protein
VLGWLAGNSRLVLCALTLAVSPVVWPAVPPVRAEGDAPLSREPAPAEGEPEESGARFHEVQPGETLWRIARGYGVDLDALARANGIEDPTRIEVGERLLVPAPGEFVDTIDTLLAQAEAELVEARFERAQQLALSAREALDLGGETAQWVRLELIDATIEVAYGRQEAAAESLDRALEMDPDLALDPRATTPKLLAALATARAHRNANASPLPAVSAPSPGP